MLVATSLSALAAPASHTPPPLPAGTVLEKGAGGLDRLSLTARDGAAQIYLHGANVTHFQPRGGRPVLWISKNSLWETGKPGKAIRGGIPICFPWFSDNRPAPGLPGHGIARLFLWTLSDCSALSDGRIRVTLTLQSDEDTRKLVPQEFALTYVITVGATLEMALTVRNTGPAPFTFEEALHTYYAVSDVRNISLSGLEKAPYIDKVDAFKTKSEGSGPLRFTAETDRIFENHTGAVIITDTDWQRRILVRKTGSQSTVIWNPWIAKTKALADLGGEQWPEFVCVETANLHANKFKLAPGASHTLTATIDVSPLHPVPRAP